MGPLWYDREVERLEKMYECGDLTSDEFQAEIRELNLQLRDAADEAAERAYHDTMGW